MAKYAYKPKSEEQLLYTLFSLPISAQYTYFTVQPWLNGEVCTHKRQSMYTYLTV